MAGIRQYDCEAIHTFSDESRNQFGFVWNRYHKKQDGEESSIYMSFIPIVPDDRNCWKRNTRGLYIDCEQEIEIYSTYLRIGNSTFFPDGTLHWPNGEILVRQ